MFIRSIFVLVLLIALSACQARTTVDVDLNQNGTGQVSATVLLDQEAMDRVPDLGKKLRVEDLKDAGWHIDGPKKHDGETVVTAKHGFASVDEASELIGQLSSIFKNFELKETRSFTKVSYEIKGSLDMTKGVESFGDDELKQRFGSPLGIDVAEIQNATGVNWQESFPVELNVNLPNGQKKFVAKYGNVVPVQVSASSSNPRPLLLLIFAGVLVVAAIVVAVVWKSETYKPRHRKKVGKGGIKAKEFGEQENSD